LWEQKYNRVYQEFFRKFGLDPDKIRIEAKRSYGDDTQVRNKQNLYSPEEIHALYQKLSQA
ncbi:hypothetical protein, partial [Faecalicoccus pleomorphus]|uniref:hypothetical protein n=1 Tax=Faecalicoccus pleomorphus TaxID=1323 RepID=UPI002941C7F1